MMVSTKGRYALRVMIDLAECPREKYITLNRYCVKTGDFRKIS